MEQKTNTICLLGFIFSFVIPVVGLILSILGFVQTKKEEKGHGLALAGIIISLSITLLVVIFYIVLIGLMLGTYY